MTNTQRAHVPYNTMDEYLEKLLIEWQTPASAVDDRIILIDENGAHELSDDGDQSEFDLSMISDAEVTVVEAMAALAEKAGYTV